MNSEYFEKKPISVGPWGGLDGDTWDDGFHTTVRQLVIAHGAGIDSIQIEYDKKGSSVWSVKHGGNGGIKVDKIKLEFPDEFLIAISGHHGSVYDWGPIEFVRSLTFQSNRKTYGPYGTQQGNPFSFSMNGGKIVGFHGRSGWYLDSIGVYLKPLSRPNHSKASVSSQNLVSSENEKIGYNVVQGSVGKGYDIVLAVRQKDNFDNVSSKKFPRNSSQSSSFSSSSEEEANEKLLTLPSIAKGGESGVVSCGPWGGSSGSTFDDGMYTGVRQINLTRSAGIISIRILYDRNGKAIWGNKHGGSGGMKSDKIVFDHPFEVLTHITGYYGSLMYMGPTVIKSITFHTSKKVYGPYGDEYGTPFSSEIKGQIVGFFGKRGWYVDSIGVHVIQGKVSTPQSSRNVSINNMNDKSVAEIDNSPWSNKLVLAKRGGQNEEVTYGVMKEPAPCGPGPWGGDGGRPWDDGVYTGVKQIFMTRSEAICSIQIEYDRNGQSVWSVRHGGSGEQTNKIKFDYPHEVVTCVCGYYGSINRDEGMKVIKSLTFYTSRGKYGPYGEEVGTFFTSTITEGKVVGFHGKSSLYLDAIGVHMQHWLGEKRPSKSRLYRIFG